MLLLPVAKFSSLSHLLSSFFFLISTSLFCYFTNHNISGSPNFFHYVLSYRWCFVVRNKLGGRLLLSSFFTFWKYWLAWSLLHFFFSVYLGHLIWNIVLHRTSMLCVRNYFQNLHERNSEREKQESVSFNFFKPTSVMTDHLYDIV